LSSKPGKIFSGFWFGFKNKKIQINLLKIKNWSPTPKKTEGIITVFDCNIQFSYSQISIIKKKQF